MHVHSGFQSENLRDCTLQTTTERTVRGDASVMARLAIFQADAEHLFQCGPRVIAEVLAELAHRTQEWDVIEAVLSKFRSLTPETLMAAGGDRFAPRVFAGQSVTDGLC